MAETEKSKNLIEPERREFHAWIARPAGASASGV
jgi:hypothetical protein